MNGSVCGVPPAQGGTMQCSSPVEKKKHFGCILLVHHTLK